MNCRHTFRRKKTGHHTAGLPWSLAGHMKAPMTQNLDGDTSVPKAKAALPLSGFPRLRDMVSGVMKMLDCSKPLDEHRLNVSCLLYSAGNYIPCHTDRPHIYRDVVFGCVLFNTSDSVLEFHTTDFCGRPTQRYMIHEEVGCCFLQQNDARYSWKHGVPPLSRGERISVTWRWFLDTVELEQRHDSSFPGNFSV